MKNVKLIALDLDGTLLMSDHWTVHERNIEAIRRAHAAGIKVCICTGRMLEDASDFCRRLGLPCMLIACNGTRAADGLIPGADIFYRQQFASADAHAVVDILVQTGLMFSTFEDGCIATRRSADGEEYHLAKRKIVKTLYGEDNVRAAVERGIMKIYAVGQAEELEQIEAIRVQIRKQLPHLQVTNSSPLNIEVMPPDAGKGIALQAMAQYLGLERNQVMAMGDAHNDLNMLEYAVHSVAMGNAVDDVKRICRYVTATNDEAGVGQMIERVLCEQGVDLAEYSEE